MQPCLILCNNYCLVLYVLLRIDVEILAAALSQVVAIVTDCQIFGNLFRRTVDEAVTFQHAVKDGIHACFHVVSACLNLCQKITGIDFNIQPVLVVCFPLLPVDDVLVSLEALIFTLRLFDRCSLLCGRLLGSGLLCGRLLGSCLLHSGFLNSRLLFADCRLFLFLHFIGLGDCSFFHFVCYCCLCSFLCRHTPNPP